MARQKTLTPSKRKPKVSTPEAPGVKSAASVPDKQPEVRRSEGASSTQCAAIAPADVTTQPAMQTLPQATAQPGTEADAGRQVQFRPVCLSAWKICGVAVRGLAHHRNGLPCQDKVAWRSANRPILVLSDGAGSAAVSELGAAALVSGVSRFLMSLEDALSLWLDSENETALSLASIWSARLLSHAQGLLADLAETERRKLQDVRSTLQVVVVGAANTFWWQVGDGAIVLQSSDGLRALGDAGTNKGEFANQTCFVDTATAQDLQFGLVPTEQILGVALMSDGGAEKLVAHDGSQVAARLGKWLSILADGLMSPDKLAVAFHEPPMWERTNLDDRSIVLAARSG